LIWLGLVCLRAATGGGEFRGRLSVLDGLGASGGDGQHVVFDFDGEGVLFHARQSSLTCSCWRLPNTSAAGEPVHGAPPSSVSNTLLRRENAGRAVPKKRS